MPLIITVTTTFLKAKTQEFRYLLITDMTIKNFTMLENK